MLRLLAALAAALAAQVALPSAPRAEPAPVPWTLTGTQAEAAPPPAPTHTVERRRFTKEGRVLVRSGFSYLSRGDFYTNPGLTLEGAWYPLEYLGVDIVSATLFFSSLGQTATRLREETGLLPDAQRPRARITTGARFSFAYGKLLVERLGTVLHFDASVSLHAGAMVTDETTNFVADAGLQVQVLAFSHLLVWVDGTWMVGNEARANSSVASGLMGTAGVGWAF